MKKLFDDDLYFYPMYKCRLCGKVFFQHCPQKTEQAEEMMSAKCSRYGHEETIKMYDYMMDGTWHRCQENTESDMGYADFIGFKHHKFEYIEGETTPEFLTRLVNWPE